ncbi:MAG: hypothetical protein R3A10_20040 [Caldilineaceae bacterium]
MIYMLATTGSPLPLSIDFTGGTLWEMRFDQPVTPGEVRQTFAQAGYQDTVAYSVGGDATDIQVKLKNLDTPAKEALVQQVEANLGTFEELSYRSIGPAIGSEVSRAALLAIALASVFIILYVAWAFRQVSHPFRFGACAVSARPRRLRGDQLCGHHVFCRRLGDQRALPDRRPHRHRV